MSRSFEEQLFDLAVRSNDGMLCVLAMQAAERLKTNADRIAALEAQQETEARAIRLAEMVRDAAATRLFQQAEAEMEVNNPHDAELLWHMEERIRAIDPRALLEQMKEKE